MIGAVVDSASAVMALGADSIQPAPELSSSVDAQYEVAQGTPWREAVVNAAAVRAQPIALTALAAMTGALFILDDPIFNGLAISLLFGIGVSTLLTLVVIPILHVVFNRQRYEALQAAPAA